ncbi:MAG: glycosyltransferase family 1 protein [Piscinibacter sp.]|nr:glycosyltransferase family 1 protein [Piscinibacter sp.]
MTSEQPSFTVDELPAARRSLRVALVTETYPPEVNGVAMTLQRLVDGLHERHHDLQLIRPRQSGGDSAAQADRFHEVLLRGIAIPRYPDLRMGVPSKKALVGLWTLHRPDLVHIATEGPLGWSALQAAQRLKLPVCSDFRTNFHAYSRHYGIGWLQRPIMAYLRKFHNRTAFTMVPTERLRQELALQGFERLRVVSRGVDTARFDPARRSDELRRQWGAAAEAPVALYVGRLAPEKNLGVLAEALLAMREVQPALRAVIVGDGPAREELQRALPDAHFAGARYGEDLARHYASADCFVFPSLTETFGNVTTEALASGLAVLAFDHAAAGQLIRDGVNGLIVRPADTTEFVRHSRRLAADPALARALGAQARETARELGWDRIVAQVEAVFTATLASAAAPSAATGAARARSAA